MRRVGLVVAMAAYACGGGDGERSEQGEAARADASPQVDAAYRAELEGFCGYPGAANGGIRLRTAAGQEMGRRVDAEPAGRRPLALLREAAAVGLDRCGEVPTSLAALGELPAIDWARDVLRPPLPVRVDPARPPLALPASATWADALGATPADEPVRLAVAYGLEIRALELERSTRAPDPEALGVTVTITRRGVSLWSTSGSEGTADEPLLLLSPRADGSHDLDALERGLALIAERYFDGIGHYPWHELRIAIASDVPLGVWRCRCSAARTWRSPRSRSCW